MSVSGLAGSTVGANPVQAAAPVQARLRQDSIPRRILRHAAPSTWAYFDFVLATVAACVAHRVLVHANQEYTWAAGPWLSGLAFGACLTFSGLVFGLYERKTLGARSRILVRSIMTLGLGLVLAYACIFLFFYGTTTRWLGLLVALLYSVVAVPMRMAAHEAVVSSRRRVLCVGYGDSIHKVVSLLGQTPRPPAQIVGHVNVPEGPASREGTRRGAAPDRVFARACPCLGTADEIEAVLREHAIDEVVVSAELSSNPAVDEAVLTCLGRRCRVTDQPTFVEKLAGEVPTDHINAQWFLLADVQSTGGYETAKRTLDVLAAAVGLALTLPLWLLIAVGIRLDSSGAVLFRQRRTGLHGREFTIFKFRTMRTDAEKEGARWAGRNDPRVTWFGRFLRLSRLDELPQLWNILKGDMSLVGPRPERPEFVEQLSRTIPHYRERHLIKPGLTGWAQINFGYGATVEGARRKLCFDLYYLKHRSIDLDFAIIIRTIGTFLLGAR